MGKRIISALCCLLAVCLLGASPAFALDIQISAEELIDLHLEQSGAEDIQEYIDTALAPRAGAGGELVFLALTQRGEQYDSETYAASMLEYLSSNSVPSAATRLKYALVLMAAGCESAYIDEVMSGSVGELGVMSWAYALHLMNNGAQSPDHTPEQVVDRLLELRLADGGWAVYGSSSDVDVTAMVLQSLAPFCGKDERVTSAANGAIELLSARQMSDGGFTSFGEINAESAAQVIIALCALDIDPAADPRFVKEGGSVVDSLLSCCLDDGGFAHAPNGAYSPSADEQALCALVAMERRETGKGSLFLLDPRENRTPADVVYTPYSPPAAQPEPSENSGEGSVKPWICAAIVLLAAGACAALWLSGRRSVKNYAVIAVAAIVLMGGVLLLDVRTPDQYYGASIEKPDAVGEVSFSISCEIIAGEANAPHVPADGIILSERALPLCEGETVYDLLIQAAQSGGFTVESGSSYIRGIAGIREHDFGQLSGWVYRVNGQIPSVGCDSCVLQPGDRVEWLYSLELGREFENAE